MSDFETEFTTMFEPSLEPVAIERNPSAATFARYRRAGLPVIVEGVVSEWPAFARWHDADHLCERAGTERVFARNLAKSSSRHQDYREAYEESSFAELVRSVYGDPDAGVYL